MKKILIISYMFPPVGGGGVVRVAKFSKYLPQYGWRPFVLTVKKAFYYIEDQSLLEEIPSLVKISRVGYFEPALWFKNRYWQSLFSYLLYPLFLVPDTRILWFIPGLIKAYKIVKKENIKIIFTSSSAYSDHLIALALKKLTKVKWVADFRDEWSNNLGIRFPTKLHFKLTQYLEKKVVENADEIIGVSAPIISFLQNLTDKTDKLDKSDNKSKFSVLTNGFDPDDFSRPLYLKNKKCHFLHAGSIYGQRKNNQLDTAIRELKLKNVAFDFVGGKERLLHLGAVKRIAKADVLILILSPVYYPGVFSGKLFEYLAARRPILALVPSRSDAAKLIRKLGVGVVVDPQDKEGIKKAILTFYQKWQKNTLILPKVDISRFDRRQITTKLARIFDKQITVKRKTKLCLIGDLQSIHNQRWVNFFKDKFELHFITSNPYKMSGAKVHCLRPRIGLSKWAPIYFFHSALEVRQIVKQIRPDIVHGQNLIVGGIRAYFSGSKPYIVTAWGSDVFLLKQMIKIEQWLIVHILKNATMVTFDSKNLGQRIQQISGRKNDLHEVQFGVDTQKFTFKKPDLRYKISLGLKADDQIVFCPRGLTKIYNTDVLIRAFARLIKIEPKLKLILIKFNADPLYLKQLINLIEELKISSKVIFLSSVPQDKMSQLYQLADLVVSIPSSDSSPVSVLEAMACGKKIILSDLPYIREWLSPQKDNFFVVKNSKIELLAKEMLGALRTRNFVRQRDFNREIVLAKADIRKNIVLMENLYREI